MLQLVNDSVKVVIMKKAAPTIKCMIRLSFWQNGASPLHR